MTLRHRLLGQLGRQLEDELGTHKVLGAIGGGGNCRSLGTHKVGQLGAIGDTQCREWGQWGKGAKGQLGTHKDNWGHTRQLGKGNWGQLGRGQLGTHKVLGVEAGGRGVY
jgi:hypothetical protein